MKVVALEKFAGLISLCSQRLLYTEKWTHTRGVMRPYPHPRSDEYITGLAAMRGGQWGMEFAEAFEVVLREY